LYKALYRKYRPITFSGIVGQEPITTTLKNQIINGKLAHSYIFTGTRGTGKTSCAKILAKAVNCLKSKKGEPCGTCEICVGIDNCSVIDVVEMDAASNNRVDDIRLLRDELNYTPSKAKFRVYIIDEVHMLSISAFNALLKVMEEPPAYVLFILATTEIHKVPATILSRCQRYDFRRILVEDIEKQLTFVAKKESILLDGGGAKAIAILSDGGMRDALSILDLVSANNEKIDGDYVKKMCGISSKDDVFQLITSILNEDVQGAITTLTDMYMNGNQPKYILDEILLVFRNILILNVSKSGFDIINCLDDERVFYEEISNKVSYDKISTIISLMSDCVDKISFSSNKRLDIEVFIIKITLFDFGKMVNTDNVISTKEIKKQPREAVKIEKIDNTGFTSEVDTKTQDSTTQLDEWDAILNILNKTNPAISSLLSGSTAYKRNESILIKSSNSLLYKILGNTKKSQDDVKNAIRDTLGFVPRLGEYKDKGKDVGMPIVSKIDVIINDARNSGIEYEEE